ncbi:carboxypeptidase regulatory-like domain-containing protein [bacterium]|nr:carboxypeptidase regulatory-like domain-containing protein [bacterium]
MNILHALNDVPMSTTGFLLLKVTLVLTVAWLLHVMLQRSNSRWRILLWRTTAIGVLSVALFSLWTPMLTLPLLPPTATAAVVETPQSADVVKNQTGLTSQLTAQLSPQIIPKTIENADEGNSRLLASHNDDSKHSVATIDSISKTLTPTGSSSIELPVVPESIENPAQFSWNLSLWVQRIWLTGALLCFAYLLIGMLYLTKVCRSSIAVPKWIETELDRQIAATPEVAKVVARQCDHIKSPCSVGLIRKIILLPRDMCSTGQPEELEAVLAHEIAHFSGNDLRWNYVFHCLLIVLWFHPLAWRIRVAHADACDERCDAKAVSRIGDNAGYIRQLAQIALSVSGQTPASALPMARSSSVTKRIEMLQQGIGQLNLTRWKAGLVAMTAALLLFLVGVVGVSRSVAQKVENKPATAIERVDDSGSADSKMASPLGLSGRLIDQTGAPVTDATIQLTGRTITDGALNSYRTKTDETGRYIIGDTKADTYRIRITSKDCVGLTDRNKLPKVQLSTDSSIVRDFTLQKACSIRIRAVDDAGKPIRNVRIYTALLTDNRPGSFHEASSTNKQGWATVGGLKPSSTEYIFGASNKNYGNAKLVKVLNDPSAKVEEVIVLSPGKDVSGRVVCSDDKPAAGWTIKAKPTWWQFGASPAGTKIAEDGSFTLSNITDDKYDITVGVPIGNGMSREERVQSDLALAAQPNPLKFELRIPSPQSMAAIAGEITTTGSKLTQQISIDARSDNGEHRGTTSLMPGDKSFRISPLPPGRYTVTFSSTEVEQKRMANVNAPSDDLKVELNVTGKPRLVGKVIRKDTKKALSQFKIRILKVGHLRGPNYVQDPQWQTIENDNGEFAVDVVGPGIYQIVASAENLAEARSEPINTDEYRGKPITLQVDSGVTLKGTVVDEKGEPIDGAIVIPVSSSSSEMPSVENQTEQVKGTVTDGQFTLSNMPAGKQTLKFTHPAYAFALSSEIKIGTDDINLEPVVMTRGGTVEGYVYDDSGQPEEDVTLYFQDRSGYGGDPEVGRFATAVTDQQGYYKVHHLPETLCYVHRAKEWTSQGVVRSAIFPANGKTERLDFGGKSSMAGKLLVNGKPLSNVKLQLGGSNPNFGVFKAFTRTNQNGEFTFWGPSNGRRTLYYAAPERRNDWIRAEEISIDSSRKDFGEINIRSTDLVVSVVGLPEDQEKQIGVALIEYDPNLPHGDNVGIVEPRANATDPFVFRRVPDGKYELVCYRQDSLMLRKVISVDASKPEHTATIEWPKKTGTLEVTMDESICGPGGCNPPNLWSNDRRINAKLFSRKGNKLRFENLPAGSYYLADKDIRSAPPVIEFSVESGGTKMLDLTSKSYVAKPMNMGMLSLRCFTKQGVPLTGCEVEFDNQGTGLRRNSDQGEQQTFIGAPGDYTMSVTFPGYQTIQRQVTVKKISLEGRAIGDFQVDVRMAELR